MELASTRIKKIQADHGLTDATLLAVLLDYVDEFCAGEHAGDFVLDRADPAPEVGDEDED